jgi:hypothetical protein
VVRSNLPCLGLGLDEIELAVGGWWEGATGSVRCRARGGCRLAGVCVRCAGGASGARLWLVGERKVVVAWLVSCLVVARAVVLLAFSRSRELQKNVRVCSAPPTYC